MSSTTPLEAWYSRRKKEIESLRHWDLAPKLPSYKSTGNFPEPLPCLWRVPANLTATRLLTVGGTVDEAAAYYTLFERACQVQLLVESTGLEKVIVDDQEAEYTQKAAIDPVSPQAS
jgi:hypothetical protein